MLKYKAMQEKIKLFVEKYRWHILVVIVVLLAAFFRFYQIDKIPPGLFSDEAVNGVNTLDANYSGNYKVFYPENNGREGLFINIQALSVMIFGNTAWALRIASGLFGTLTVLFLYFLTKALFDNRRMAIFASFFLATSFWHINFSRIGFRAIMAPFFLTAGTYLTWRMLSKSEIRNPNSESNLNLEIKNPNPISCFEFRASCLAIFAGFVFGLGFHSYIAYRIAPLILLPPLVLFIKEKKFKEVLLFIVGVLVAVAPLAVFFYQHPQDFFGRTSQISIFTAASPVLAFLKNLILTIGMFFVAGDFNWRHNYRGSPELLAPVAIFFLIGLIISLIKIFKKDTLLNDRMTNLFLYFWFGAMFLPIIISSEGLPHALRAIPLIPVVMIFAAMGLEWLIARFKITPRVLATVLGVLVAFITMQTYNKYFVLWANRPEVASSFNKGETDGAYYLNSLPQSALKYVIMETDGQAPMSVNTVMFLTGTYLPDMQKEKNINYILKKDEGAVPPNAAKIWIR